MLDLPLNVDFSGKVVVVTGAGGVLCGTMARAFAQAGAKVAALDLNEEAVKALADECKAEGFVCEGYQANVLEPEALKAVHQKVLADLGPLGEAVYNLLTNGCEAALAAGREPSLALRARPERLWTVLEVRDNGGGIPPELQSRIYEPFFTSKNTNYNWGMGLYYVRRIVKSHFGRLRLESRMGEGSSFFIMLPLYDAGRRG